MSTYLVITSPETGAVARVREVTGHHALYEEFFSWAERWVRDHPPEDRGIRDFRAQELARTLREGFESTPRGQRFAQVLEGLLFTVWNAGGREW